MNSKAMAKAAWFLMSEAADVFGDHGCNDLNLDDLGLTRAEQIELVTFMNERNRTPEQTAEDIEHLPDTSDFCVMYACAAWLKEMANE